MAKRAAKKQVQPKAVDEAPPAEAPVPDQEPAAAVEDAPAAPSTEARIKALRAELAKLEAPQPEPYPAWRYHRSEPARIVQDEAGHLALGDGWADSPDAFKE